MPGSSCARYSHLLGTSTHLVGSSWAKYSTRAADLAMFGIMAYTMAAIVVSV